VLTQAQRPVEAISVRRDGPMVLLDDPIEQWLLWEEQANLVGFRTSVHPVPIEVAAVPRDKVSVRIASWPPAEILSRFLRADRVLFPRHPLNQDRSVKFSELPAAEHWVCRYTSSRTLVVVEPRERALFSIKLATDRPHPDFHQPEKTRMREEVNDALVWVDLIARIDGMLGADPNLLVVKEVFAVLVPRSETAYLVRDLRAFQDGHHYLPALSIPWVGRQIARARGERFEVFWGRHYAEAVGRAKARFFVRYGLQYETPNPQNVLVQLDTRLRPTGRIMFRDLGDANCATDARSCAEWPWTVLRHDLRPETKNSFWAFAEAAENSVDAATLEDWYARHDAAYFEELAKSFPLAAPPPDVADLAAHWSRALRGAKGKRAVREGFSALLHRPVLAAG
jgi:hypothetical protein